VKKKLILMLLTIVSIISLIGCTSEADTVSNNLSKSADSFEVQRRVVFVNGITDKYLLSIEGLCAITDEGTQLEVTCKVDEGQYKKHFLGLSDNVTYFVEQTDAKYEDAYHYKVIFRPEAIIPDIDLQTSNQ
jgi:protein involved in sex pheromone biosynthesis